jgi:uncharacterized linocin/CFP29 family protein
MAPPHALLHLYMERAYCAKLLDVLGPDGAHGQVRTRTRIADVRLATTNLNDGC